MNPEKGTSRRFVYIGQDTIPGHPECHPLSFPSRAQATGTAAFEEMKI